MTSMWRLPGAAGESEMTFSHLALEARAVTIFDEDAGDVETKEDDGEDVIELEVCCK